MTWVLTSWYSKLESCCACLPPLPACLLAHSQLFHNVTMCWHPLEHCGTLLSRSFSTETVMKACELQALYFLSLSRQLYSWLPLCHHLSTLVLHPLLQEGPVTPAPSISFGALIIFPSPRIYLAFHLRPQTGRNQNKVMSPSQPKTKLTLKKALVYFRFREEGEKIKI